MTKDYNLYFLIVDNEGDLSMFWFAHKNEENQCNVEGESDTSKSDPKIETNTRNYKNYKYTSGVVVKLVKNILL